MIYLGLDPGTSDNMALAALVPGDCPLSVVLVEAGKETDARDRAAGTFERVVTAYQRLHLPAGYSKVLALEWQRPLPTDKNPKNISDLSAFAGIALGAVQAMCVMPLTVLTPLPEEWKGQVPKHIKHNRIVARAGLGTVEKALRMANIPVPKDLGNFKKEFTGKAGNAIDAIGLALWARERSDLLAKVKSARLPPS